MIGVVGATHLGLVRAAVQASPVVLFDPDPNVIRNLRRRVLPIYEPGLSENLKHVRFNSTASALAKCKHVYIARDIDTHNFDELLRLKHLISQVLVELPPSTPIVLLSQVPPGFTRSIECDHKRLFNQLDDLIFGRAIERGTAPEQIVIGASDPGLQVCNVMRFLPRVDLVATYEQVELAKMAINCYLANQIATSDALARLSEKLEIDWANVCNIIQGDTRLGSYLLPSLGIGGGHMLRDLNSVKQLCQRYDLRYEAIAAPLWNNFNQSPWLTRTFFQAGVPSQAKIAVWGLAYKAGTSSVVDSPGLRFVRQVQREEVFVHDPVVDCELPPTVKKVADPLSAIDGASCLIVATPWECYRQIDLAIIAQRMSQRTLIDPYRAFNARRAVDLGFDYYALGWPNGRSSSSSKLPSQNQAGRNRASGG